ncbi:MAG: DUF896 domain-containing protein [Ruminococcus sp.]|nr:DUF896 domain-containing protein [Ruminococcus sp.]
MELLEEINYLAKKKKEQGLTEEEQQRQQELRKEYLKGFRAKFKTQLDNVEVEYPDGTVKTLKELRNKK